MTIRELKRQVDQIAIEYENCLDQVLDIGFDSADDGYFRLIGIEINRSLGTGRFTLDVIEA